MAAPLDLGPAFEAVPYALLIVSSRDSTFRVEAANTAFLKLSGLARQNVVGRPLFEVFPSNPQDPFSSGRDGVLESFRRVIASGAPDKMLSYRYDLERPVAAGGGFERRYWSSQNTPLLDGEGRVAYILQSVQEVTQNFLAEERASQVLRKLQESEARFQQIAETSGFGLVIANRDGRLTYVNSALLDLLGYTEDEVMSGQVRWDELTPPEHHDRDAEAWEEVLETGKCVPYEKVFLAKDGCPVPILIGASLLESTAGGIEVAAFVKDLTARKQNEQQAFLVRLDDATRPLIDPADITRTAEKMVLEYMGVNRCAHADVEADEDTFNLTGDHNRDVPSIVGRYKFGQFGAACLGLMRAGEPFVVKDCEGDDRCDAELASYRRTQIRAVICVPILKAGKFVAAFAVHQFVPRRWRRDEIELVQKVASRCWESIERTRVTRALQVSEERHRILAESIPQMVWTATPSGDLAYVNDQVKRYFDTERENVLGAGWIQWVHPDDQLEAVQRWKHCLGTGETYEISFRLLRGSDQTWRWHLVRACPLSRDGVIVEWAGTCTDFEDQKNTERQLAEQANQLKRSNEDLEQFAHVASHDLRSPLNTVLNFTELLVRKHGAKLDPEIMQYLEIVGNSAKRMSDLILALLAYSRLNDAESKVVQPVSSLAAYEDAVANLRAAIEGAQAQIERDELPEVLTNATQLLQVFQNLISNAIHYRGDAPPRIRVTAERQNSFWLFSVIDNGPGIAPQYHALIFEPFKRLHGHDRPGSGIGLAFCRKFIEREGGTMWVESEEGQGARFRFTLPAVGRDSAPLQ